VAGGDNPRKRQVLVVEDEAAIRELLRLHQGGATHIHLQVFVNGAAVKTTQIAFPEDVSADVYRTATYASHGQNSTTNSRDNVFADGIDHELAALAGDTTTGYTATLTVGVAV
jgi:hypothetical protein